MTEGKKELLFKYIIPSIGSLILIIYLIHAYSLKSDLREVDNKLDETAYKTEVFTQLARIDSTLLDGSLDESMVGYRELLDSADSCCTDDILLRMRIAEWLNDLMKNSGSVDSVLEIHDTVRLTIRDPAIERKKDSLIFALQKSQFRIQSLEDQLLEKSYREYLTFENAKGTKIYYVGEVNNGKANGKGVGLLSTGSRYEGEWKNGMKHGQGSFIWPDGEYYIGNYVNDKREGEGTYHWPTGEKYIGEWKNDKRNGKGNFYDEDGELTAGGIWKGDKLVEERKKESDANN